MDGPTRGTFSGGGGWLCTRLWEHYLFTRDQAYFPRIYPLLKGSAEFFLDTPVREVKTSKSGTYTWTVAPREPAATPGSPPPKR